MKLTTVCVRTGCFKKHCKVVCCYTPVCKAEACKDADQPKRADNPQSKKQEVKPNVPAAAPKAPVKK